MSYWIEKAFDVYYLLITPNIIFNYPYHSGILINNVFKQQKWLEENDVLIGKDICLYDMKIILINQINERHFINQIFLETRQ